MCSLVASYQLFREAWYLHLGGRVPEDDGNTFLHIYEITRPHFPEKKTTASSIYDGTHAWRDNVF
jgi:hypothetical protein